MSSQFAEDHAAFQALVSNHFQKLQKESELWLEARRELETAIERKDIRIRAHEDTIRELEKQLAEARRVNAELREAEASRKQSEKGLGPDGLRTLKEITPPKSASKLRPTAPDATSESEKVMPTIATVSTTNIAVGTDSCEQMTEREKALHDKYDRAQKEANTYKQAHRELIKKYTESKEAWQKWTQVYQKEKKSRRRETVIKSERTGTPTPSEKAPPPPFISPMKANPHIYVDANPPIRPPALSSKPPTPPLRASSFSGFGSDNKPVDEMRQSAPPSLPNEETADSQHFSSGEIPPTPGMDPVPRKLPEAQQPPAVGFEPEEPGTSDGELPREGSPIPKTARTRAQAKTSESRPSTPPVSRKRNSDGTQVSPIVIKSESSSESEGPGYFVFQDAADSFDLDAVEQPERKKLRRSTQRGSRITWKQSSPERLRIRQPLAPLENTNEEILPPLRDPNVAKPSKKRKSNVREATPEHTTEENEEAPLPKPSTSKKVAKTPHVARRRISGSPITPKTTSPSKKATTAKKRREKYNVDVVFLADGTDGIAPVTKKGGPPDIDTSVVLDNILTTPAPKIPTLLNITRAETGTSSSAPPKPRKRIPWGGDGFAEEAQEAEENLPHPPAINTPKPNTRTTRQAHTDPPRRTKNSADPTTTKTPNLPPPPPPPNRPLTISDFKVNPLANNGLSYAYQETVRRKADKECLPSCTKPCCRDINKFVTAAGVPKTSKGLKWKAGVDSLQPEEHNDDEDEKGRKLKEKERQFLQRFGRHKDTFGGLGRRPSPPGFWDSEFPDTQEVERRRREADMLDEIRVEQLRREAEKGVKGKYVYKGK
ncbi:hypothetical protein EX30DRAFT_392213 [Ascodesmis nigricans]|uniref:DNA endonuclease activator Ctp1 C-terminal domain-containing protein n=1 Tax=Ascodesmis nigricans TaxID=341454 RepID=A0A4S2N6R4_9PEZI|nr:hypothetical protein EX30DRAFT_392213 [Ascodesmis nigricans]